jgi:putative membrane protein
MRYTHRSTLLLGAAAAAAVVFTAAAQRTPSPGALQQRESTVSADSPNAAGALQSTDSEDVEFLTKALRTSLAEAEMGQLAQQRGGTAVKEFGRKLAADHTRSAQEIKALLGTQNVTPSTTPTVEAEAHTVALAKLSGAEFDAAFLPLMVESHEEAIEEYGAQTHANPNKGLAEFAAKSLPTLREHLATAQSLQKGT